MQSLQFVLVVKQALIDEDYEYLTQDLRRLTSWMHWRQRKVVNIIRRCRQINNRSWCGSIIDGPLGARCDEHDFYDRVYEWYTSGPRQRLQPGGRIILVMTRWNVADLTVN